MESFNPSGTLSSRNGLFGVPTERESARIVIIPVPWEVTTSYGSGASMGPEAILKASTQIDLFDLECGNAFEHGYHLLPIPQDFKQLNAQLKQKALALQSELEDSGALSEAFKKDLQSINRGCSQMTEWVYEQSRAILGAGQIPAVLGGDHSTPEGNIRAICESYPEVGVLHVDAHADLRSSYQGFEKSHASIMYNVMAAQRPPKKLVQVGIRDFCREEFVLSKEHPDIKTFYDVNLKVELFEGRSWASLCNEVVNELPQQVYISFDIDGLSPEHCPGTGTPVPGGLSFDQANYLFRSVAQSGRRIVGFDLNEVSPGPTDWDGNVGARLLFKLCGWTVLTQPPRT